MKLFKTSSIDINNENIRDISLWAHFATHGKINFVRTFCNNGNAICSLFAECVQWLIQEFRTGENGERSINLYVIHYFSNSYLLRIQTSELFK